jgi:hypothetical protein
MLKTEKNKFGSRSIRGKFSIDNDFPPIDEVVISRTIFHEIKHFSFLLDNVFHETTTPLMSGQLLSMENFPRMLRDPLIFGNL